MSTTVPISVADAVTSSTGITAPIPPGARYTPLELQTLLRSLALSEERVAAQRQAVFALGEGDALQQRGDTASARQKWQEAATAYERAGDGLGAADAYLRLANSYLPPALGCIMTAVVQPYPGAGKECATGLTLREQRGLANLSEEALLQGARYYLDAMLAGAEVYDDAASRLLDAYARHDETVVAQAAEAYELALTAFESDDCPTALAQADVALRLYRSQGHQTGELRALTLQALCRLRANQFVRAFALLFEALDIAQNLPTGDPTDTAYLEAGRLYEQGDYQAAQALYLEVLDRYLAEGDAFGAAQTRHELGNVAAQLGLYGEAERWFAAALADFEEIDNRYRGYNLATVHHNLGNVAMLRGNPAAAQSSLETALALWRATGDPAHEADSLNSLALVLRSQGCYAEALDILAQAEALADNLPPDPLLRGDILNNIGYVYYSQGRYDAALEYFQQGLDQRMKLNEPQRSQKAFESRANLAAAHAGLHRYETALDMYADVLAYAEQSGSAVAVASVRVNMANIHVDRGDYQRGIVDYSDALPVFRESGARPMVASVQANLGTALLRTGQTAAGEEHLQAALAEFEAIGDPESQAALRNNWGLLWATAGHYITATHELTQALGYWEESGNRAAAASTLSNLALLTAAQQEWETAQTYGERALAESTHPAEQVLAHSALAAVLLASGDAAGATEQAQAALAVAQSEGDVRYQLIAHQLLATIYVVQGEWARAEPHVEQGLALLEEMRGRLSVTELKASFLGLVADIYDLAVLVALAQDQPERAFSYAEQARARAFLDQLSEGRIEFRTGANAELLAREQDLRQQMRDLEEDRRRESDQTVKDSRWNELERARTAYEQLLIQLKATHPEYANLVDPEVRELAQVQADLAAGNGISPDSTLIVYYALSSPFAAKTAAWVIDAEQVTVEILEAGEETLEHRVDFAVKSIVAHEDAPKNVGAMQDAMGKLYDTLFAPLLPHIHTDALVIAPHGPLHSLPFAALWDAQNGRYLLERYTVSYVPSASTLPLIAGKRNDNGHRALLVGSPSDDLPDAQAEAGEIAALYSAADTGEAWSSTLLTGTQSTEARVRAEAEGVDVLHLATHGTYNAQNALFSRIKLAASGTHDGHLEVHEIYDLALDDANLVVLSACETNRGELTGGDELVALTRAFIFAGAPTVVSTLWEVPDEATAPLMVRFHQRLLAGDPPAEALRTAQRGLLGQDAWHAPYHWAAFGVYGLAQ